MPMNVGQDQVQRALGERFGIEALRGDQEQAITAVLEGRDLLLTMPTGGGKSLVYQLPAVLLDGLTLVVSPLIALMKDQVDALRARGIAAQFVNSSVDGATRRRRLEQAAAGELDLLFVTPERFRSPVFREFLPQLAITRLAVDEAHCISHWGHDFRPDYSRLALYRRELGSPPTMAFTATATPAVARDIVEHLELDDPVILRSGIERPNLFLGAHQVFTEEEKLEHLADRIQALDGAGIVYSTLIKDLEQLHSELARRGIGSLVYHGGLSPDERRSMQDRFMASERDVVLATNAFGMGVDKADIRFVLHAQLPRTLEAWAQEVGRAGRDGETSFCELVYFEEDIAIQQNFIKWANPDLEYLFGVFETLRGWGERIQIKDLDDLRAELLLKERRDNRVSICLKWLEVLEVTSGSFETRDLEVVKELGTDDLPDFVGSGEKLQNDLRSLLGMVQFAKDAETCRRVLLARHFELQEPTEPCGACDACAQASGFLSEGIAPRQVERREPATRGSSTAGGEDVVSAGARDRSLGSDGTPLEQGGGGFQRGDWVKVDGRHVGQVLRVEGKPGRQQLLVESVSDLKRRRVDTRRQRVDHVH